MVQFIEKHRRLLQAYCLIARILGWLLILGGIFWLFAIVKIAVQQADWPYSSVSGETIIELADYFALSFVYDFFIPGILAFAIAGLLDYLLRPKDKPPLILGMMDKLCYLYAAFVIYKALGLYFFWLHWKFYEITASSKSAYILLVQPLLGPTLAKVLLLIGVGMILHRLLPVIEESKTLV
jgi:hypothetical protein